MSPHGMDRAYNESLAAPWFRGRNLFDSNELLIDPGNGHSNGVRTMRILFTDHGKRRSAGKRYFAGSLIRRHADTRLMDVLGSKELKRMSRWNYRRDCGPACSCRAP